MRTSGRSGPDPGHAGTEDADEPASVTTTPDRGACTCPPKALVAKRDRRALSTGSTSSSTLRSLRMVPCISSFESGKSEASIRPSRPTMSSASQRVAAGSRRSSCPMSTLPPLARIWAAISPAGVWFGPKGRASLPRERTPWPRRPRPSLVRPRPPSPCHRFAFLASFGAVPWRGLVRSRLRGAPNRDRGCRDGWALAQNAVWFS
jgi:hypothetical protein